MRAQRARCRWRLRRTIYLATAAAGQQQGCYGGQSRDHPRAAAKRPDAAALRHRTSRCSTASTASSALRCRRRQTSSGQVPVPTTSRPPRSRAELSAREVFNAPAGRRLGEGEARPRVPAGRDGKFRASGIAKADQYARVLVCPRVHVMWASRRRRWARRAARRLQRTSAWQAYPGARSVPIEPINPRIPGFFLNQRDQAHAIVIARHRNLKDCQMDLYHCQIVEGVSRRNSKAYPADRAGGPTCRSPACPSATSRRRQAELPYLFADRARQTRPGRRRGIGTRGHLIARLGFY